jgi:hypothetical protein
VGVSYLTLIKACATLTVARQATAPFLEGAGHVGFGVRLATCEFGGPALAGAGFPFLRWLWLCSAVFIYGAGSVAELAQADRRRGSSTGVRGESGSSSWFFCMGVQ